MSDTTELNDKLVSELREIAKNLGIAEADELRKAALVTRIVEQEQLIDYYKSAKVHVLPSWFETTGLSSLEAAAMGCSIVITDKGDTKEYFGNHAVYCSPSSASDILSAVEKAAGLPVNDVLQQKIFTQYTWQQASRRTAEGYKKIINPTWH